MTLKDKLLNVFVRKEHKEKTKFELKIEKTLRKYLTFRYILIGIIGFILFLLYTDYFKGLFLMVIFLPLALYTTRITKFIEGVTIETHTASTVLMGFLYGPQIGELCGFILTGWAYIGNGVAKVRAYLDIGYTILAGYIAGWLSLKGLSFGMTFTLAILAKNIFSFLLNHFFFDPDKMSNLTYRISHLFLNVLIYRLFFEVLYNFTKLF
ncbi:MAG: hypothetical protein V1859_11575 [archaeon]